MKPDQIPQLIKRISYADPRILPAEEEELIVMTALWASVLADVDHDFALHAVGRHYAQSPFTIRPSDIAILWHARVKDLAERHVDPVPAASPDNEAAYRAELGATRQAAASNVIPIRGPRAALGPGMPEVAASSYAIEDIHAIRIEGDIKRMYRDEIAKSAAENDRRKALVLKHDDLAKRLTEPPVGFARPDCWTGFVPMEHNAAGLNRSPIRQALAALVAEAERRAS